MAAPRRVVLATGNAGKVRELAALLAPLGMRDRCRRPRWASPPPRRPATPSTANALLKARHAARAASCRHWPMIPASRSMPWAAGRASGRRRYAGPDASDADNNALLLDGTGGACRAASRTARYRCVIAYVRHPDDPAPLLARGSWEGMIATAPAGTGGFGYDPLFIPAGSAMAPPRRCPPADKNRGQPSRQGAGRTVAPAAMNAPRCHRCRCTCTSRGA